MSGTEITSVFAWEALDSRGTPDRGLRGTARRRGGGSARPSRPARRPAATRPASCATAASATADSACGDAVAIVEARSRPRSPGSTRRTSERVDAALLRARTAPPALGRLGANAVLAVSVACALAAADAAGDPLYQLAAAARTPLLPLPMVNVLSGGAHARGADSTCRTFSPFRSAPTSSPRRSSGRGECGGQPRELAARTRARGRAVADEGGLGPALGVESGGARAARSPGSSGRAEAGRGRRASRSTSPRPSCIDRRRLSARGRGRSLSADELVARAGAGGAATYPDRLARGPARGG